MFALIAPWLSALSYDVQHNTIWKVELVRNLFQHILVYLDYYLQFLTSPVVFSLFFDLDDSDFIFQIEKDGRDNPTSFISGGNSYSFILAMHRPMYVGTWTSSLSLSWTVE